MTFIFLHERNARAFGLFFIVVNLLARCSLLNNIIKETMSRHNVAEEFFEIFYLKFYRRFKIL